MSESEQNQPISERRKKFSNLRALGSTALAIFLYLLVADAAIEAFWNKSPVRWWVAVVVAVYLGGSVVLWWRGQPLWQRASWETRAMVPFFVLLGLLAFTAWLPDGLDNGLTLLSLSTSTLLSLATAAAVAFAGIVLFSITYPHQGIKWAIAVLAVYAVIAFLHGIVTDIPYPDLFHGASLWTKLPFWLQGAFIGALIAVPLAVIVDALRLLRGAEGRKWKLQRTAVLAMSLMMAVPIITRGPAAYPTLAQYAPKKPTAVIKAVSLSSTESDKFDPAKVSTEFSDGVKQVVVWYRWEDARKGHRVELRWSKDGSVVLEQGETIEEPSGSVSWFLARDKNEPLPAGTYKVELLENGETVTAIPFRVGN